MTTFRTTVFALLVTLAATGGTAARAATTVSTSGGYVDESAFRALVDDQQDVVEINLDGAILQALAKNGKDGHHADDTKDVLAKLKSIHAVIGTVKGSAEEALALVQKTDRKLGASGWQRITRVTDATSTISVLTHTVADKIDGLVVLIFDSKDKELVFANLAGEIDITQLGEIGERLNVPGLDQVPGAR
jgi:spermidine/putrescine-binding protein